MNRLQFLKAALAGSASLVTLVQPAAAKLYDIPDGDLSAALVAYIKQSDSALIYVDSAVRGHKTRGVRGDLTDIAALTQVLKGTGFAAQTMPSNAIAIIPAPSEPKPRAETLRVAAAAPAAQAGVETVVVTAQKKSEDIQQVPIAVSAFSQKDLTERQIAGGPDLVKEVPNLTFSKTNFSGYNLEIRGIGTQAISVTTDPAVAVAFNDIPFIRNHFFEQEFYDLQDVEVLRGPQGTLYGRNATAGVVNIKSALPTDQYESMMSADLGNYNNRRLEGMINIPIVGDTLDLRIAGEWTKRDGYSTDTLTDSPIDGRDLWSGRVTLGWKPTSDIQTEFVWEHFSEDDDRLRSGKQLCKTDYGPGGTPTNGTVDIGGVIKPLGPGWGNDPGDFFVQGCSPDVSLYSPQAFEVPLGYALPYILGLQLESNGNQINPYPSETQSTNLRDIESGINPIYRAKNDTLEFNANYTLSPAFTLTSQTGYNQDFLFSAEDYNRFGASPGLFRPGVDGIGSNGVFCDPQLGCSNRLELEDLSEEHAWQFSQEFRIASNFSGPLNFSAGANYLHYETVEYYYVFGNVLTLINGGYQPGRFNSNTNVWLSNGFQYPSLTSPPFISGGYVDPNSIFNLNNEGHNYFLSQNPYVLNSYATFGEATYRFSDDLTFTTGLRWTDDQKHFLDIPSWLVESGYGYPVAGAVNQQWGEFTGRAVANWTPQLDFTDQTLVYASYAHGYKAGGANPPGAIFSSTVYSGDIADESVNPTHPLTFKPEFIESFEFGTKNTLLGGALTVNGDIFYYNYTGYQISEIVDRTAINTNYNAHAEGAELETNWEPLPGLKFGFAGGYENTALAGGDAAVDLMDRTAGMPGWVVVKPFVNEASNCIFPIYVAENFNNGAPSTGGNSTSYCAEAYDLHNDPLTGLPYVANPTATNPLNGYGAVPPPLGYAGYNPLTAPNDGAGFSKHLGGNELPNAPHFTTSLTAEYTMPVSDEWAATFHTDLYWQSQQWARVFEDPIDKLHGYSNVNLALTLTSANGWEVMGYVKNVFDVTAITGTFLNSDDSGLTTNVFLTDPRLFGVRVTKHLDQGDGFWGSDYSGYDFFTDLFADRDSGKPPLWIELGGQAERLETAQSLFTPPFFGATPASILGPLVDVQRPALYSFGEEAKLSYTPEDTDWIFSASIRYGRGTAARQAHQQTEHPTAPETNYGQINSTPGAVKDKFGDAESVSRESHMILDFEAGQDVGLGLWGAQGTSIVSAGVRYAQFASGFHATLHARPFNRSVVIHPSKNFSANYHYYRSYTGFVQSKRNTKAFGPIVSWDASLPVVGNDTDSKLSVDWGLNAAVLFGRQRAHVHHQTAGSYHYGFFSGTIGSHYAKTPPDQNRARNVTIPNIGGFAGISWNYRNAKVSFGYRADEFFGAMDGGIDTHRSENVGFFGPFANISIGLGG